MCHESLVGSPADINPPIRRLQSDFASLKFLNRRNCPRPTGAIFSKTSKGRLQVFVETGLNTMNIVLIVFASPAHSRFYC